MGVSIVQGILGSLLILSSIGVIAARKPVYSGLSFLLTLLSLSALYLQLDAPFIAVMQVLVYAGAILVIFMFVIILFQDAHQQIEKFKPGSNRFLLLVAALSVLGVFFAFSTTLMALSSPATELPPLYGTVQSLGRALYIDFFFPFEAVILIFLVAVVGALYMGKKEA